MNQRFPYESSSRTAALLIALLIIVAVPVRPVPAQNAGTVVVGSKAFTESVVLGEVLSIRMRSEGIDVRYRPELGGTRILWNALVEGDIDVYPEYTGTILQEILADTPGLTASDLDSVLAGRGVRIAARLGFNNTYALGMSEEEAERLGIERISDLRGRDGLSYGLTNEFLDRGDGWRSLARAYDLSPPDVRGMQHDLAYRALESGAVDVVDLYSTDAEIEHYDIRTLEDDRNHFPRYDAVVLIRLDLEDRMPAAVHALETLEGTIDEDRMIAMNRDARIERTDPSTVAAAFLETIQPGTGRATVSVPGRWRRIAGHTADHLVLVLISLTAAILLAIPLGVIAARRPAAGTIILGVTGMIYTIPALALLVFMIPLLGIGGPPAVVALFLYSLLPIVRNTHSGLVGIAPPIRESAEALGLSEGYRLRKIDLPLASPAILAGIKTSAVINIGTATLGALIGAGGLGQPILTGIRLADTGLILEGAVPAALLAVAAQFLFDLSERWIVPGGLRLPSSAHGSE